MYVRHVGDSAYLNSIHRDGPRSVLPVHHKPASFFSHEHVLLSKQAAKMESRPVSSSTQCELTFAKAARWSRYERGHGAVPRSACRRTKIQEFPWALRPDPGLECPRYSLWGPEGRKGEVSEETQALFGESSHSRANVDVHKNRNKALISRSMNDLPRIEAQQATAAISLSNNYSFLPTSALLVRFVLHF
ncbi:hypothetical protein F5141DRAFT_1113371 [Pisolithus sp. B1]|nr:hypothetical protein F5141DRAFT_1113371 [Pisolithus sp. B1]